MQDFNLFCWTKIYMQTVVWAAWLQDPYKLWRMLQVIKKNTKFTATRMDPVACSNYHNQPSVAYFRPAKRSKSCMRSLTAPCWLVLSAKGRGHRVISHHSAYRFCVIFVGYSARTFHHTSSCNLCIGYWTFHSVFMLYVSIMHSLT